MRRLLPLLAALLLAAPGAAGAADLTVVSNNIENMPEPDWPASCKGNWRSLIGALKAGGRVPDVLLLQQMGGQKKLAQYIAELESQLGAPYSGTLAIDPFVPKRDRLKANGCKADRSLKAFQTNAIIWRTDRLTPADPAGPFPPCRVKDGKPSKTTCFQSVYASGSGCAVSPQARTLNAGLRFTDAAGKRISVASIHWGSGNLGDQQRNPAGWNRCAEKNARNAVYAIRKDSDLQIFGGDANLDDDAHFDNYIRKSLHFTDVGLGLGPTGTRSARRDFLFARTGAKQPAPASGSTVIQWEGKERYSEHRAIVTTIAY